MKHKKKEPTFNDISTFYRTLLEEEDLLKKSTVTWATNGCILVASLAKDKYQATSLSFFTGTTVGPCFYQNQVKQIILLIHPIESVHILNQLEN